MVTTVFWAFILAGRRRAKHIPAMIGVGRLTVVNAGSLSLASSAQVWPRPHSAPRTRSPLSVAFASSLLMFVGFLAAMNTTLDGLEPADVNTCAIQIAELHKATLVYEAHFHRFPADLHALRLPMTGRILRRIPLDPWGQPFQLVGQRVVSSGRDKMMGTSDDLSG